MFDLQKIGGKPFSLILLVSINSYMLAGVEVDAQTIDSKPTSQVKQSPQSAAPFIEQGLIQYRQGNYAQAESLFQQSVDQAISRQDRQYQGLSYSYLSLAQQQLQKWSESEKNITLGLEFFKHSESSVNLRYLALALNIQGRLRFSLGQTEQALSGWEQAEKNYAQIQDTEGVLGTIVNQVQALTVLGYHHRACKKLLRAISAEGDCNISPNSQDFKSILIGLRQQPDVRLRSLGLLNLANLLRLAGNYDAARDLLNDLQEQVQSPDIQRSLYISLGKLHRAYFNRQLTFYQRTSNLSDKERILQHVVSFADKSMEYYYQAAQLASTRGPWGEIQSKLYQLEFLSELQSELGNKIELPYSIQSKLTSLPDLKQQLLDSQLNQLSPSQSVVQGQLLFAQQLFNQQTILGAPSYLQSLKYAQHALSGARQINDLATQSQALGFLGKIYEQEERWQDAQDLTEQALSIANSRQDQQQIAKWQWQMGRLYDASGDRDQALKAYQQAVQNLGIVRNNLRIMRNEVEFSFREDVEPVYREYVNLLLQTTPQSGSQVQLEEALQVFDDFQVAELEDFLNCNLLRRTRSIPDSDSAFVYPIILDDRIDVIIQSPNNKTLVRYTTPVAAQELNQALKTLRKELERNYFSTKGLNLSQQVYDWILGPAMSDLEAQGIKTLVFVLDGPLRSIPLNALHDGKQYLIERGYSIALLPGLELFESLPRESKPLKALTFGLAQGKGKEPLPAVTQELTRINQLIDTRNFLDQSFSKQVFVKQLLASSVPIIHLATHGQFSSNPEETYISTYDQDILGDELSQLLQSRANTPNLSPIELLVLSACKTATGDPRAILGLAGIAIQSGARSTLSSLWAVNDESTALLMSQFYKELVSSESITKAEALRRAQVQLLKTPGYESPRYWAAFVLVGNWN